MVPSDNNWTENDLRVVKFKQWVPGCVRTPDEAKMFHEIRNYPSTARTSGHNTLDVLRLATTLGVPFRPPSVPSQTTPT
jgi:hypothetical protein